jgi:hypothetical protein
VKRAEFLQQLALIEPAEFTSMKQTWVSAMATVTVGVKRESGLKRSNLDNEVDAST